MMLVPTEDKDIVSFRILKFSPSRQADLLNCVVNSGCEGTQLNPFVTTFQPQIVTLALLTQ